MLGTCADEKLMVTDRVDREGVSGGFSSWTSAHGRRKESHEMCPQRGYDSDNIVQT